MLGRWRGKVALLPAVMKRQKTFVNIAVRFLIQTFYVGPISLKDGYSRGKTMEVTKTDRLLLRDLMEADFQSVHRYSSDPEVVRYMSWGPNTEEETKNFIQRALAGQNERPRRNYTLAIVVRNENELIGSCSICVSNLDNGEGWIGYCLNRHFWGKGYATETASALVDFGFDILNFHRIFATCDPANTASAHVLEKIGMKREGRMREHMWARGKWRDSLLYSILEHERVHARRDQR